MTEVNLWALGGIGLIAGLLGSMLGVGGGVFIVPLLTLALHLPIQIAIGNSLVAIVATSCIASISYIKARLTNIKLGLLLETASTPGAIIGALAIALFASHILSAIFGVVLVYIAYSMIVQRSKANNSILNEGNLVEADSPANQHNWSTSSYYDTGADKIVNYKIRHIPTGLGASFFAGILSGLLGIGGGVINVPVMNLVMALPIKAAIATSSFVITMTAAVGALVFYYHGYIYPIIVTPLIIGACLGASLGTQLTQRARGKILQRIFASILFITAILMFLQAINIGLLKYK